MNDDSSPTRSAWLLVCNGDFKGMRYDLTTEETLIGRNPTTQITLLDDGISREHALILYDASDDTFSIEDLQSTNGTKVNGKRVRSATLQPDDEILVGNTCFRFCTDED